MLSPRIAGGKRLPSQAYRIAELILEMTIGLGVTSWELKDQDTIAVLLGFDASDTSKAIARLIRAELLIREDLGRDGWRFALRLAPLVEASREAISIWSDLARLAAQRTPNLIPPSFDERRDAGLSPALTEVDHESIRQQAASIGRAKPPPAGPKGSRPPVVRSPFDAIRAAIGAPRPKSDGEIPHSAGPGDGPQHQPDGEIPHQVSPGDGSGAAAMGKFPIGNAGSSDSGMHNGEIPHAGGPGDGSSMGKFPIQPGVLPGPTAALAYAQAPARVSSTRVLDLELEGGAHENLELEGSTSTAAPLAPNETESDRLFQEVEGLCTRPDDKRDLAQSSKQWKDRAKYSPGVLDMGLGELRMKMRGERFQRPKLILAVLYTMCARIARESGKAFRLW